MFERPLKLTHNDSHRVYFTSDTHFNHDKAFIYESSGYKNRYEHNDALITKINEVVRPQDTLFHLGDFCLNITPPEFDAILSRINCNNIAYIWGNHNSCIRRYYEDADAQGRSSRCSRRVWRFVAWGDPSGSSAAFQTRMHRAIRNVISATCWAAPATSPVWPRICRWDT